MQPGDGSMRASRRGARRTTSSRCPTGADPALVAALGLSAVAAWMALTWRGGLRQGERVLVLGAGGVVGQAAVQLARSAGAGADRRRGPRGAVPRAGPRAGRRRRGPLGDTDDVAELAARMRAASTARSTWSSTRCSATPGRRGPAALRPHGRLVNLGGSAGGDRPARLVDAAQPLAARARLHEQRLTPDQRAGALTHVVGEVLAGRLTAAHEPVPLVDVTAVWDHPGDRVVLVP